MRATLLLIILTALGAECGFAQSRESDRSSVPMQADAFAGHCVLRPFEPIVRSQMTPATLSGGSVSGMAATGHPVAGFADSPAGLADSHTPQSSVQLGILGGYGIARQSGTIGGAPGIGGERPLRFDRGIGQSESEVLTFSFPVAPLSLPSLRVELQGGWTGMQIRGDYVAASRRMIGQKGDTHSYGYGNFLRSTFSYASLAATADLSFFEYLHVGAGLELLVPLDVRSSVTIELLDMRVGFLPPSHPDRRGAYVFAPVERMDTRIAAGATAYVGGIVPLREGLGLLMRVSGSLPVASMFEQDDVGVATLRGMVGVVFDL